eukprot:127110_1
MQQQQQQYISYNNHNINNNHQHEHQHQKSPQSIISENNNIGSDDYPNSWDQDPYGILGCDPDSNDNSRCYPIWYGMHYYIILNININPHSFQDCHDSLDIFTVELTPLILAIAEPSSCKLRNILAIDESIKFGLGSFCNDNASETRISFEQMLYKNHASDQIIAKEKWNTLPITNGNNNIRRLLVDDFEEDDSGTNGSSLHIVWTNGKSIQIANDSIFPYYDQCIAVDDDTLRVFSVGGQINGQAINRLSVHEIISKTNAKLSEDIKYINLTLDRPRYATMCYFYRNKFDNNKEYIIVINGMNNINEINNNSNWYNDIVFIPLNEKK